MHHGLIRPLASPEPFLISHARNLDDVQTGSCVLVNALWHASYPRWSLELDHSYLALAPRAYRHHPYLMHKMQGLDVNSGFIEWFRCAGDAESAKNHARRHVTSGDRWFTWLCDQQGVDSIEGSFKAEADEAVGLTKPFYEIWGKHRFN